MTLSGDYSILKQPFPAVGDLSIIDPRSHANHGHFPTLNNTATARRQRSRCTFSDIGSFVVVFVCCLLGTIAVADYRLSSWLGQTYQLIVIGIVLYLMAAVTFKEAQKALLMYEARFGQSLLQNYDAILRNDKLNLRSSFAITVTLWCLFALPLCLSAVYKTFVGGTTTLQLQPNETLSYGPTGPPGAYLRGVGLLTTGASQYFSDEVDLLSRAEPGNYGFNMHIVNDSTTTMLDIPERASIAALQSKLKHGQTIHLESNATATYASLNSTPNSPERQDPDYWNRTEERLGNRADAYVAQSRGGGAWLAMYNSWVDSSIVYVSYFNASIGQTFESEAIAFNIYRGTAHGVWRITPDNTTLVSASQFHTDFSPMTQHPEIKNSTYCDWDAATDATQKIIYCVWTGFAWQYSMTLSSYFSDGYNELTGGVETSPISLRVVAVASMAWGNIAGMTDLPKYQYLFQDLKPEDYSLSRTTHTMQRHAGLYLILCVQPLLLTSIFLARLFARSTPIPEDFNLVTFLAGVKRESLNVVQRVRSGGREKRRRIEPVVVHFVAGDDGEARPSMRYVLALQTGRPASGDGLEMLSRATVQPKADSNSGP